MPKRNYKRSAKPSRKFVRMVKKVVDASVEHEWKEGTATSLVADASPASATVVKNLDVDVIGHITQGDTSGSRDGDRIKLMSLEFRAAFVSSTATVGAARLIIGQCIDQQDPAAMTLTYGQVLAGLDGTANNYIPITAVYDHQPLVKYRILSDEVFTWDTHAAAAPKIVHYKFSRQLAVRNRNYDGTSNKCTGSFFYMWLTQATGTVSLSRAVGKIIYTDA